MNVFSESIKFKYSWRKYQQRVLEELNAHVEDDHLHVIAPPGSGKTVLGLEVMLRLGKPTLILAPTLAIRNQWIQRFCELFLQEPEVPEWISKDIRMPGLITVVTYQGLHSACNDSKAIQLDYEEETDVKVGAKSNFRNLKKIVAQLKEIGVATLLLDESNHLKNEWWQTLSRLKKDLKPKVVGLTATPPYDVTPLEWHRYIELNGAIDVEISVPELIAEGDLCPHQDFVYFTKVSAEEKQKIVKIRDRAKELFMFLKSNPRLIEAVQNHPMMLNPLGQEYYIFENLNFYSACLIFLKEHNLPISTMHLEIFGVANKNHAMRKNGESKLQSIQFDLPPFDEKWLELILKYALFEDGGYFEQIFGDERESLIERLRHAGVVDNKSVRFSNNPNVDKRISSSISKLLAIEEIVSLEYQQQKRELRQVVLTDYVRKEYLVNTEVNDLTLKQIGVMSIFEQHRRNVNKEILLGVLTGTLVVIPVKSYDSFLQIAASIRAKEVKFDVLAYDSKYLKYTVDDQNRDQIVHLITQLFQQGGIEVLIGTKALLGEGWDAPTINSLILASVVGSFVSSNQMRGRAIRTTFLVPNKTSNIWHIACVDPSVDGGGVDVEMMERRFRNIVGISEDEDVNIQNGIKRLSIYDEQIDVNNIEAYNIKTIDRCIRRDNLHARWLNALPKGSELVEEIKIPYFEPFEYKNVMAAQMQKGVKNSLVALFSSVLLFIELSSSSMNTLSNTFGINSEYALSTFLGVGVLFFCRRALNATFLYYNYRDISKDIYQIGNALVQTLCKNRIFISNVNELRVLTFSDKDGSVYCHLDNGTTYEKSVFVQMIQEIVNPIHNPRYIIVRKSKFLGAFRQTDYHAVPEILARRATLANDFFRFWKGNVGDASLMFTRSLEGCRFLIHSRVKALSNQKVMKQEISHVNTWR